ncbi:hypothetical protein BGLA2_740036 [Burkholderia gladioli]|nr:hypothetical protein BGLA2_740036 [Burkholderia gladioli]
MRVRSAVSGGVFRVPADVAPAPAGRSRPQLAAPGDRAGGARPLISGSPLQAIFPGFFAASAFLFRIELPIPCEVLHGIFSFSNYFGFWIGYLRRMLFVMYFA